MIVIEKKANKAIEKKKYNVYLAVDCSASMIGQEERIQKALTEFFNSEKSQAEETGIETLITAVKFGSTVSVMCQDEPVQNIFVEDTYKANMGSTSLYDAVGILLNFISTDLNSDAMNLLVVHTDGLENTSKLFNKKTISAKIEELQSADNWTVMFIGEGEDTLKQAMSIGVDRSNSISTGMASTSLGVMYMSQVSRTAKTIKLSDTAAGYEDFKKRK